MGVVHNKAAIDKLRGELKATQANAATANETLSGLISGVSGELHDFLPDEKTLVLASSTAESVKRFAITVDDDGKISATEIVVS